MSSTRNYYENVWKNPSLDSNFNDMFIRMQNMLIEFQEMDNLEDRCVYIKRFYDYVVEIKEHLYMFGPTFNQILLEKINHLMDSDYASEHFQKQMYEYKIALLPYIRKW